MGQDMPSGRLTIAEGDDENGKNRNKIPALSPLRQEDPYTGARRYGADPVSAVLPEMQICVRGHIQKRDD